jgi:G-protein coupled receptor 98
VATHYILTRGIDQFVVVVFSDRCPFALCRHTLSYGELRFTPGDRELEIAVNIIDDDAPEEEERFRVVLRNPKGGAEIGFGGQMTVLIPTNDDAHGVIGFAQVPSSVA